MHDLWVGSAVRPLDVPGTSAGTRTPDHRRLVPPQRLTPAMPWLLRDGQVLASAEVADSARARMRGLLGRDGIEGVLILRPAKAVHTLRLRFPIDVAFCDRDMTVVRTLTMARNRVGVPVWRSHCVIEAEAGSFERWRLAIGDTLEIEGEHRENGESAS